MGCEGHETARFLLPPTGETIEILPGSMPEVEFIYNEIFEDGVYSKHGLAVRAGDVVVDVGANIGMFCMYAASQARADHKEMSAAQPVTYYGLEALPPVFEVLRRNVVGMQEGVNVKALLNVALGDQERECVPFTLFPRLPGNSTLNLEEKMRLQQGLVEPHFYEGATQYLMPMRTLSDVMEEHSIERVDFLKVDVEGAELMVLKGVKEAHWSRISQIVVEVPNADEVINNNGTVTSVKRAHLITHLLKKHGFVVNADFDYEFRNHMIYACRHPQLT